MGSARRIAAILAFTATISIAAGTTAGALGLPAVTTPTVTTPPVTAPAVTTPIATVPKATAPVATTPKVTTPKVTVAPITTTSPTKKVAPQVTTPKLSSPGITVGGGPGAGGSTGNGSKGGGGGAVGKLVPSRTGLVAVPEPRPPGSVTPGGTGAETTPSAGNGTVVPALGGGPGGPSAGGGTGFNAFGLGGWRGPGGGGNGGSGGSGPFALAVASLAGCFYALTPFEQQVLTVRTGIDGRQPLSRNQLAAALGVSPAALGRTERTALGRLETAARTDGCMPVATISTAHALTAFVGGPFGPVGFVTPAIAPVSRTEPGTGGTGAPSELAASTSLGERLARLDGAGAESLWVVLVITLLLSGALAALARETRRSF